MLEVLSVSVFAFLLPFSPPWLQRERYFVILSFILHTRSFVNQSLNMSSSLKQL